MLDTKIDNFIERKSHEYPELQLTRPRSTTYWRHTV